jgi:hypothetical protein
MLGKTFKEQKEKKKLVSFFYIGQDPQSGAFPK